MLLTNTCVDLSRTVIFLLCFTVHCSFYVFLCSRRGKENSSSRVYTIQVGSLESRPGYARAEVSFKLREVRQV
jgi:hypothetical protein